MTSDLLNYVNACTPVNKTLYGQSVSFVIIRGKINKSKHDFLSFHTTLKIYLKEALLFVLYVCIFAIFENNNLTLYTPEAKQIIDVKLKKSH